MNGVHTNSSTSTLMVKSSCNSSAFKVCSPLTLGSVLALEHIFLCRAVQGRNLLLDSGQGGGGEDESCFSRAGTHTALVGLTPSSGAQLCNVSVPAGWGWFGVSEDHPSAFAQCETSSALVSELPLPAGSAPKPKGALFAA